MEHAVGTVYVQTHAMGFVLYSLSAVHLAADMSGEQAAQEKCRRMYARLWYWEQKIDGLDIQWAPFLTKEDLNLEKLLRRLEKFGIAADVPTEHKKGDTLVSRGCSCIERRCKNP
jgi:hypothetical protein